MCLCYVYLSLGAGFVGMCVYVGRVCPRSFLSIFCNCLHGSFSGTRISGRRVSSNSHSWRKTNKSWARCRGLHFWAPFWVAVLRAEINLTTPDVVMSKSCQSFCMQMGSCHGRATKAPCFCLSWSMLTGGGEQHTAAPYATGQIMTINSLT